MDLIYRYRPDRQAAIREELEHLIQLNPDLVLDESVKSWIRFGVAEWDSEVLRSGVGWTRSRRIPLFVFANLPDSLVLALHIGPGPEEVRQKLAAFARSRPTVFNVHKQHDKWIDIYRRPFLTVEDYIETSTEEIRAKIGEQWGIFVKEDLPALRAALREEEWLWQQETTSAS